MMDEYDPMPDLMAIVEKAAPELKIMIGAFDGNTPTPFAFLRSVGGPEEDAQVPDAERRLDITVFAATEKDANRISNRIHRYIRRGREEQLETDYAAWLTGPRNPDDEPALLLPSLFSAGGPLDILERDVKLPGVFRSYYLIYAEDEDCD